MRFASGPFSTLLDCYSDLILFCIKKYDITQSIILFVCKLLYCCMNKKIRWKRRNVDLLIFEAKSPKQPKNPLGWISKIYSNSPEITDNPIILKGNEWPCSRISKSTQKCCHIRRVNTFKLPKLFYYQLILFFKALFDFTIGYGP